MYVRYRGIMIFYLFFLLAVGMSRKCTDVKYGTYSNELSVLLHIDSACMIGWVS